MHKWTVKELTAIKKLTPLKKLTHTHKFHEAGFPVCN